MTTRKNYNSVIFLTTLSVYLGLVLVGAPAPVLAQAALTSKFEVKDKVERKDDLDEKPSDEELKNLSGGLEGYFENLEDFIEDLQKLHSIEKFDLDYDSFVFDEEYFVPCKFNGDPVPALAETTKKVDNQWLEPAITDASYKIEGWDFLSDCLPDKKFKVAKSAGISLGYDKSEFKYGVFVTKDTPQKAKQLAENFIEAAKLYEIDEEEINAGKLYENTSFKFENNQVFITTRLPRGSLDTLLVKDGAK